MASNHLLKTSINVSKYRWSSELARGSQHVHTPDLKEGDGLGARVVDILRCRCLLALHLAETAGLQNPVDLRNQTVHEDSLPAEVGC